MTHPNPVPVNSNNGEPRTLGRRTLLRGAAHSVWALPAIQIAATAPAYADSGAGGGSPEARLQVASVVSDGAWLSIPATINNGSQRIPVGGTVIVAAISGGRLADIQTAPEGWMVTTVHDKKKQNQTLVYTYTREIGAHERLELMMTPAMQSNNKPDLILTLHVNDQPMPDPITLPYPWGG